MQHTFPEYEAVCWPCGSGEVAKADFSPLAGRNVYIWPDADDPGYKASGEPRARAHYCHC